MPALIDAPLRIPVELKRGEERWFRLANAVGAGGLLLSTAVPDELDGPLELRFHLPGDAAPLICRGRPAQIVVGTGEDEHAERRALGFVELAPPERARIERYVEERTGT
jgi:hypothetical protein